MFLLYIYYVIILLCVVLILFFFNFREKMLVLIFIFKINYRVNFYMVIVGRYNGKYIVLICVIVVGKVILDIIIKMGEIYIIVMWY